MSRFKKIFLIALLATILVSSLGVYTPKTKAATISELQAIIAKLLKQINYLQEQLNALKGKQTTWCHTFNVNLKYGDRGLEVRNLAIALSKEGFKISGGNDWTFFNREIASAVVGFQEKYKEDILAPWGLEHGTGFVGRTTRKKLNELYGCNITPPIGIISGKGIIRYIPLEGGFYGLITYEGRQLLPLNLPQEYKENGLRVEFKAKVKNVITYYQWGTPVEIIEIRKIGKKSLITVLSPNGGETWEIGKRYEIRWKSNGIKEINIELLGEEGYWPCPHGAGVLASSIDAALEKFEIKLETVSCYSPMANSWSVKKIKPGINKYKIWLIDNETHKITDSSDDYFSIVSPAENNILYKTKWDEEKLTTTLLRSDDGGKTWKAIRTQYKGGITYATDSKNPKIIYAGDTGGNTMSECQDIDLVKSTNGGDKWIDISKGVIETNYSGGICSQKIAGTDKSLKGIDTIWVNPYNSNEITFTLSPFEDREVIFKSIDGGSTWTRVYYASF